MKRVLPSESSCDSHGLTPLFVAVHGANLHEVNILLAGGASPWRVSTPSDTGRTSVLHEVARTTYDPAQHEVLHRVVELLTQVVNPLARDDQHRTPLMVAVERFNVATTRALLRVNHDLAQHRGFSNVGRGLDLLVRVWPEGNPDPLKTEHPERLEILQALCLHTSPDAIRRLIAYSEWTDDQVQRLLPRWFSTEEAQTLQQVAHEVDRPYQGSVGGRRARL